MGAGRGNGSGGGAAAFRDVVQPGAFGTNPAPSARIVIDEVKADGSDESARLQQWVNSVDPAAGAHMQIPAGSIGLGAGVSIAKPGITWDGWGRRTTRLVARTGYNGDLLTYTNSYGSKISNLQFNAQTQRSAGRAIVVKGGDANLKLLNSFPLDASCLTVQNVDMDLQFSCMAVENNAGPPLSAPWIVFVDNGRWRAQGGEFVRLDASTSPGTAKFGASHFFHKLFMYANPTDANGIAIRITGTGDATFDSCETFGMKNGLMVNPPAGAFVEALRFTGCFFDSAGASVAKIAPDNSATLCRDIVFNGSWFSASLTEHGLYLATDGVQQVRAVNCTFLNNNGYGVVFGGGLNNQIDAGQFWTNVTGGVIATRGAEATLFPQHFAVRNCQDISDPVGIQVNLGCDWYIIAYNDLHQAGTPLVDNGGAVNKLIAGLNLV